MAVSAALQLVPLISIHALLAESDIYTHPVSVLIAISIHALLAESDLINTYHRIFGEGISIHALLAESDNVLACSAGLEHLFLSTLSLRRATAIDVFLAVWAVISIHALLAESDFACIGFH